MSSSLGSFLLRCGEPSEHLSSEWVRGNRSSYLLLSILTYINTRELTKPISHSVVDRLFFSFLGFLISCLGWSGRHRYYVKEYCWLVKSGSLWDWKACRLQFKEVAQFLKAERGKKGKAVWKGTQKSTWCSWKVLPEQEYQVGVQVPLLWCWVRLRIVNGCLLEVVVLEES